MQVVNTGYTALKYISGQSADFFHHSLSSLLTNEAVSKNIHKTDCILWVQPGKRASAMTLEDVLYEL